MQWLDPLQEDFQAKYNLAYAKSKAYQELLTLFETAEARMNQLRIELGTPDKNYQTGT